MNHPLSYCRERDPLRLGNPPAKPAQQRYIPSSGNPGQFQHSPPVNETPQPAAADFWREEQLERILARVPPLLRLPAQGSRCPHTSLCRTAMLDLVAPSARNGNRPPVRAIYRRAHKYAQRGVWLIPAENLFRHLLGLMDAPGEESRATRAEHQMSGTPMLSAGRN